MSQLLLIPKQEVRKNKKTVHAGLPAWLPEAVAGSLAGISSYAFNFSSSERKVFLKRKPVLISEWAERHRVLEMSSIPGKWKNIFFAIFERHYGCGGNKRYRNGDYLQNAPMRRERGKS